MDSAGPIRRCFSSLKAPSSKREVCGGLPSWARITCCPLDHRGAGRAPAASPSVPSACHSAPVDVEGCPSEFLVAVSSFASGFKHSAFCFQTCAGCASCLWSVWLPVQPPRNNPRVRQTPSPVRTAPVFRRTGSATAKRTAMIGTFRWIRNFQRTVRETGVML